MYADPTHIRDNPVKVRFNDPEDDAFSALARLNGMQKAVFVREMALLGLETLNQGKSTDIAA